MSLLQPNTFRTPDHRTIKVESQLNMGLRIVLTNIATSRSDEGRDVNSNRTTIMDSFEKILFDGYLETDEVKYETLSATVEDACSAMARIKHLTEPNLTIIDGHVRAIMLAFSDFKTRGYYKERTNGN